ncbi:MAG: hypothetical protein JWN98_1691 [Abditibacteriota bacterium]|nr:hypothetical protein [Abditibacteriota bacterium]
MFPFFCRKKSKYEIVRDAISDRVHEALEYVPVDKLEHLKESLSETAHSGGHKVSRGATHALGAAGDVLHSVALAAAGVKEHIGDAATGAAIKTGIKSAKHAHGVRGAVHNVHERAHDFGEGAKAVASHTVSGALESAHAKAEAAKHAAEAAKAAALERIGAVREAVTSHAHDAGDHLADRVKFSQQTAQDAAQDAAGSWTGAVDGVSHIFAARKEHIEDSAANVSKIAAAARAAVVAKVAKERTVDDRIAKAKKEVASEVEFDEGGSKFLWIALGVVVGGVLLLLLAPSIGRRNRAALKDKLSQTKQAAAQKAADLKNRASGAIAEVHSAHAAEEDDADDNTIADRVRTELGQNEATRELPHLNIDCVEGIVTVRGPMMDTATSAAIQTVVGAVKGVKEVRPELLIEDAPEDEATFVG